MNSKRKAVLSEGDNVIKSNKFSSFCVEISFCNFFKPIAPKCKYYATFLFISQIMSTFVRK